MLTLPLLTSMKLIIGYMPAFGVGVMDRDYMYCIFLIYQLVDSFRRHPMAGVQFSLEAPQGMALVGMPPREFLKFRQYEVAISHICIVLIVHMGGTLRRF